MISGGKRILMAGGEGVVLFAPSVRGIEREIALPWDVPNFEQQLSDILTGQHQTSSVTVLFDGADQTYRKEENIPKLTAFDRPRFVKRKLDLAFPSYPIRAAMEIKPAKKLKGEKATLPSYLFVALPETEQLDRIGKALFESGVAVSGFGLLPAEAPELVTQLASKVFAGAEKLARWNVLIGQHETGGLRQVVVKDGNLALTRLTPASDAGINGASWAEEVMREFKATLTYLSRFGFSPDDGLNIMIVCGAIEKEFFDPQMMNAGKLKCITAADALRHIGFSAQKLENNNFSDVVHAAWAAKKNKLKMPVKVPSIDRVSKPRKAARVASVLLLLSAAGLLFSSVSTYFDYQSIQRTVEEKQNQKTVLAREYGEESKIFDALPIKPDVPKAILAAKKLLEVNSFDVVPFLEKFKTSLGADITLDLLEIEHKPGIGYKVAEKQSGGAGAAKDPLIDRGLISIKFGFSLPDKISLEEKVTKAEMLQDKLKKDFPGFKVKISTQFGNVSRVGSFKGDAGSAKMNAGNLKDRATFEMEGAPL